MIAVIGHVRFPADAPAALTEAIRRIVEATRSEAGCLLYAFGADLSEPGLFHVSELWESKEALDAHFVTPHMREWQSERAALRMIDREISVLTVTERETR